MPSRSLLALLRRPGGGARAWLGLVLALAVALKLLVPQGWMPSPDGGLMLCPQQAPALAASHGGHHAVATAHATHGDDAPGKATPGAERCAFAGLGLSATPATPLPTIALPPPVPIAPAMTVAAVAIGRGLAAPPPPATGPPAFA